MSPRVSGSGSVLRPGVTKAVLAGVVATTLGLAACGSDADGGEESSPNSSAPASAAAKESEGEHHTDAAAPQHDGQAPEQHGQEGDRAAGQDGAPGAPGADGARGGEGAAPAPAEAGDDAAQITALEEGFGVDRPYSEYMRYTIDHTCNADLDQRGGREALLEDSDGDGELANTMMSETMGGELPVIHGVNDIHVDGDHATANLDQSMNGNRQTLQKNYVREDGQWRTCAA